MKQIEPIHFFIFGTKRGGTTLLRLMLDAHPKIHIPNESHFLAPILTRFDSEAHLTKKERKEIAEIILHQGRFDTWTLGECKLLHAIKSSPSDITLNQLIAHIYKLEANGAEGDLIGEKTPEYIEHVEEIRCLFPDAKFIFIVRDPRDVSNSLKSRGWEGWTHYQRGLYWNSVVNSMVTYSTGNNSMLCRYEDLVGRTEQTLIKISSFLGVDYNPLMLSFNISAKNRITKVEKEKGIHKAIEDSPSNDHLFRWKRTKIPAGYWFLEYAAQKNIARFGYEFSCYQPEDNHLGVTKSSRLILYKMMIVLYNIYHGGLSRKVAFIKSTKMFKLIRDFIRRA